MKAITKHLPTPAMLVACVALVVAFGGVSYAAAVLPKNSVGTVQLMKKAVTGAKLKKNAVTGAKVKNRPLMAADFKAGQLPAGPQGPKGDPGPQGRGGRGATLARRERSGPSHWFGLRASRRWGLRRTSPVSVATPVVRWGDSA